MKFRGKKIRSLFFFRISFHLSNINYLKIIMFIFCFESALNLSFCSKGGHRLWVHACNHSFGSRRTYDRESNTTEKIC